MSVESDPRVQRVADRLGVTPELVDRVVSAWWVEVHRTERTRSVTKMQDPYIQPPTKENNQ